MQVSNYSNQELIDETALMIKKEKAATHAVLVHLREIDRRQLYLDHNYKSLHAWCMGEYKFSAGEANYRIAAMRFMRGSKKIEKKLENGQLSLTNAVIGWQHVQDNKPSVQKKERIAQLLQGKTNSQAKEVLGYKKPKAKPIRKQAPRIKVNEKIIGQLDELKAILQKDEVKLLEQVLEEKLTQLKKKRAKQIKKGQKQNYQRDKGQKGRKTEELTNKKLKPKAVSKGKTTTETKVDIENSRSKVAGRSRYIPRSVDAMVRHRADDRCENVNIKGVRCNCREKLELHHVLEFCKGGPHTIENLQLLCKKHHRRETIKTFGPGVLEQFFYEHA